MIRRLFAALALVLLSVSGADAQRIKATWTAPTANTNGTPLTDLAGYRVYIRTAPIPCPVSGTYKTATVSNPVPTPGLTVTRYYTSTSGIQWNTTYYVRVLAVD